MLTNPTWLYNWILSSSTTLTNTLSGNIVVTIPETFAVDLIEIAVAATPINVDFGVYSISS